MKKFMIVSDMEGMAGVTSWDDVTLNNPEHDRYRNKLTKNICDMCNILKDKFGEDTKIVVKDGHWTGRNILHEYIPSGVTLVTGKITDQPIVMEQADKTYDGVIFMNFHAPSPTLGNPLAHTESNDTYISFKLNGELASELSLFAYEAAMIGLPIIAVTGDEYTCIEARSKKLSKRTVATKISYGGSVESKSDADIYNEILDLFENFKEEDTEIISMPERFELEVTYVNPVNAYHASYYPGAKLLEPNKILIESNSYYEIRRAMMFI